METPIVKFLKTQKKPRFHMPGHAGNYLPLLQKDLAKFDITEIAGADELFKADGIIAKAEENTASLYGCETTCFSAGGSTACIQAMLAVVAKRGGKIIATHGAHAAFINACIWLELMPVFTDDIKEALRQHPDAIAIYVTSPDYYGRSFEIRKFGDIPLLVDSAHGAHLAFLTPNRHPMQLGATMCCDSAHKTLPVLTGGAFLHANGVDKKKIKKAMSMFASSSPSYLILASLDMCNRYLASKAKKDFAKLYKTQEMLKKFAKDLGLSVLEDTDPTKLLIYGSAAELDVAAEYQNEDFILFLLSPQNTNADINKLKKAISKIKAKPPTEHIATRSEQKMLPRDAFFAKCEQVKTEDSAGRISTESLFTCPPGIPIVLAGEVITPDIIKNLKISSISMINVVI